MNTETVSENLVTQKQTIKLIRKAYDALAELDRKHMQAHRTELFNLCKAEEKDHRGFIPSTFNEYHPNAATIADCARLFAVVRIAEYLNGEKFPSGKDYLHFQKSAFYAAGLVDEFRADIEKDWQSFDVKQLASLDYCKLVKPESNHQ